MLLDPAGRSEEDILLLFVTQGNEPAFFTKFFRNWETYGYSVRFHFVHYENLPMQYTEIFFTCKN